MNCGLRGYYRICSNTSTTIYQHIVLCVDLDVTLNELYTLHGYYRMRGNTSPIYQHVVFWQLYDLIFLQCSIARYILSNEIMTG